MHLIIDGYNLLHVGRSLIQIECDGSSTGTRPAHRSDSPLIGETGSCEITVVFDGWQGGWATEKRERQKGIESDLFEIGEKADEVIKRMVRRKGQG